MGTKTTPHGACFHLGLLGKELPFSQLLTVSTLSNLDKGDKER